MLHITPLVSLTLYLATVTVLIEIDFFILQYMDTPYVYTYHLPLNFIFFNISR